MILYFRQAPLPLIPFQIKEINDTPWAKWRENAGFTDGAP